MNHSSDLKGPSEAVEAAHRYSPSDVDCGVQRKSRKAARRCIPCDPTNVPCFMAGTLVMTPYGEVPIESLRAGDVVVRPDGEWAIVTEVRATPVGSSVPMVEFAAGSVAPGVPSRTTVMTQDHRVGIDPDELNKGWEFCGTPDVVCEPREVDFVYNLRLDGWKSTFIANGLVADTLQTGDWRLSVD